VVHIKSVPFAMRLDGDVGYVPLRVFRNTSSDEVRAAVDSLRQEGIRSLVLDLRGNPGGLLDEGIGVAELFVGEGARVVETRGRAAGQSQTFAASRPAVYADLPTAVLIDGTSASASEIVAGALQDHDRALLVGMPSYGKGSVQTLFRLSGGNVLRLTTARWYTPVGRSIDRHPQGQDQDQAPAAAHGSLTLSGALLRPPSDQDRPTFESDGGRTLYGGGGIVPDVRVLPDTLSSDEAQAVRALYRHAGAVNTGLFSFAVQYNQDHPDLQSGFRLTDGDLARFRASLADDSVEIADDVFRGAARYLRYQLEREVALQALGDQGEFEQTRSDDTQLNRALTLLRQATSTDDLLKVAGAGIPNDAAVAAAGGTDESSGS
jgi:carboxyl-terminal processing protease